MEALTNFFLSLFKISLTAGITAGIILLVRPLAAKKLPRRAIYVLWAIVLLRLGLPFSLPAPSASTLPPPTPHSSPLQRKPAARRHPRPPFRRRFPRKFPLHRRKSPPLREK